MSADGVEEHGELEYLSDSSTESLGDGTGQILFEIRKQVAWITIHNPDHGNAISPSMRDRLGGLLRGLNGRFETRAAVITGSGRRHFCTGADLTVSRDSAPRLEGAPESAVGEIRRTLLDGQIALMSAILDCDVPVVAAVNGTAAGVGVHLALCCDLVLAGYLRLQEVT